MKIKKLLVAMCVLAFAAMPALNAADDGAAAPKGLTGKLAKELNLSAEQIAKVEPIVKQRIADLTANTKNKTQSDEQRDANAQKIRDEGNAKIRALLTPEQQTKFDASTAKASGKKPVKAKGEKKTKKAKDSASE